MTLLLIYLLILLLGIAGYTTFVNATNRKALYLKHFTFSLIVLSVYSVLCYAPDYAIVLYSIIGVVALYEIYTAIKHLPYKLPLIAFATLMLALFIFTALEPGFPNAHLFLCVISFDAFSQFFGQLFGKHQLSKKISPNKTIEGSIGGVFICMFTSYVVSGNPLTGIFIAITALSGDLLASLIKRKAGIKDFSNLLPGQGGMLDRFDSFILSSVAYLILYLCHVSL